MESITFRKGWKRLVILDTLLENQKSIYGLGVFRTIQRSHLPVLYPYLLPSNFPTSNFALQRRHRCYMVNVIQVCRCRRYVQRRARRVASFNRCRPDEHYVLLVDCYNRRFYIVTYYVPIHTHIPVICIAYTYCAFSLLLASG